VTCAQLDLIDLALSRGALRFGQFTLKSGRESPYFFNAGLFSDGEAASILGRCYAAALLESGIAFDMLFGPAQSRSPSTMRATSPTPSTARRPKSMARGATSSALHSPDRS
jgi:hypothetical protein